MRGFCNDVRTLEPARWTFVTVEGAEPTNNAAVLWRKGCFGADSTDGNTWIIREENCHPERSEGSHSH